MAQVPLLQADNVAGSTKSKKKPKAGKGSMIYFADGYFEELQKKAHEEDPEIGEIVANMVDMGGRVSAGQDKFFQSKSMKMAAVISPTGSSLRHRCPTSMRSNHT
jgi:hypothetical protein